MEMEDEMEVVEGMGMGLSELIIQVLQQIITPHPTRTRPISGMGSGTLVEVHTPLSYTVRRNSSTRPRDRWSASTFSSVAIHVQVITKPNLIMSASSSRRRSFRRCALDRPLAPDFWKLELSMKNCTTQPPLVRQPLDARHDGVALEEVDRPPGRPAAVLEPVVGTARLTHPPPEYRACLEASVRTAGAVRK